MPKILITGNGFDLSLGLPTAYCDFIKILKYIESVDVYEFNAVFENSLNFDKIVENFKSFDIPLTNIDKLKALLKENLWYSFFSQEFEIESWIDFEMKIEYVLGILFSSIETIRNKVFLAGSIRNEQLGSYEIDLFNKNIEVIEVLKNFKIVNLRFDNNIELNKDYLISKYNHFIDINLDRLAEELKTHLTDFKLIFNLYFEIFVFPLYKNLKSKITIFQYFNSINKHYTFNYTPTFEKIYKKANITSFLHGKIDSTDNKIVLGINDIPNEVVNKKYFLPFTKYFQKLDNDTDYKFLDDYSKKLSQNYQFFFWGHSLDKSDEDYINEVFDFLLNLKTKKNKIVVIFHNEVSKSILLRNLLSIRGKKNIQDMMRSELLSFKNILSEDLKIELKKDISSDVRTISVFNV